MGMSHVASIKAALTGAGPSTINIYRDSDPNAASHSTLASCRGGANFPKDSLLAPNAPYPDNTTDPCLQSVLRVLRDNGVRPLEGMPSLNDEAADSSIRDALAPGSTGGRDRCDGAGEVSARRSGIPSPGQLPRRPIAVHPGSVGPPARRPPVINSGASCSGRYVDSCQQPCTARCAHVSGFSPPPTQAGPPSCDTANAAPAASWQPAMQQAGHFGVQAPSPFGAQSPQVPMMMIAPPPPSWMPAQGIPQPYQMYPMNGYVPNSPVFNYPSLSVSTGGPLPWGAGAPEGSHVPAGPAAPASALPNSGYTPRVKEIGSIPRRFSSVTYSAPHGLEVASPAASLVPHLGLFDHVLTCRLSLWLRGL
jgi:hypothetical protein